MIPTRTWIPCLALALVALMGGCGSGGGDDPGPPPPPPIFVDAINAPLFSDLATTFVVEGEGFGAPGDIVLVRFLTVLGQGTPFSNGTSEEALVEAVVLNDFQCIGLSPPALSPGSFLCYVDVLVGNNEGLSEDPIATFLRAPAIPNVDYFPLIAPDRPSEVILIGGPGPDTLLGGPDVDELLGGGGNDYLDGFGNDDLYIGGPDLDAFVVDVLPGNTDETFVDFVPEDDIVLTFGDPNDVYFSVLEPIAAVSDDGLDVTVALTGGGSLVFEGLGDGSVGDLVELLFAGVKLVISLP